MALVVIRVPEETSVLRPQHWQKVASLLISSRGTLSAHNAVFLTESAIISLLCMAPHAMTNMSLTKVFLR
jgi:hypothetical protein